MSLNKKIKKCFVEYCGNDSEKESNKIFVSVPNELKVKKIWFDTVRLKSPEHFSKTSYFCCEDHFDIKNDMENYMYYRYNANVKIKMKHGVIPHKFNWPESVNTIPSTSGTFKVDVAQQTDDQVACVTKNVAVQVKPSVRSQATLCNIAMSNVSNKKVGTSDTFPTNKRGIKRKLDDSSTSTREYFPTSQEVVKTEVEWDSTGTKSDEEKNITLK